MLLKVFKKLTLINLRNFSISNNKMANSKFEYVRKNEDYTEKILLDDCFIVVRIDGKQFHQFSKIHNYLKPNDKRALDLMNKSAEHVMMEFFPNIIISYGQSDEYSFVFHKNSRIFNRRQNKLISIVVSAFSSAFVFYWNKYFSQNDYGDSVTLQYPPSFDSRCILYSTEAEIIDYLKWRQVDCHINNLYNTTFYALTGQYTKWEFDEKMNNYKPVKYLNSQKPLSPRDAEEKLKGSVSEEKKEKILRPEFKINYNMEPEQFKKGTLIYINKDNLNLETYKKQLKKNKRMSLKELLKDKIQLNIEHSDIINDDFWVKKTDILKNLNIEFKKE